MVRRRKTLQIWAATLKWYRAFFSPAGMGFWRDWGKDREKRRINSSKKKEKRPADMSFFRKERSEVSASASRPGHSCLWKELVLWDTISFAEQFDGEKTCKDSSRSRRIKSRVCAGVRDDDVREDGMCIFTVVTEYPQDTQAGFFLFSISEVNDGSAIVVMDVTVSGAFPHMGQVSSSGRNRAM